MLREETAASPAQRAAALAGLNRYQDTPRANAKRPMPARFRKGVARLRDYGGDGPPVVFVPSLINPPAVLDLTPERSIVRWIAAQGFHAWLLDWGAPTAAMRDLTVADHVERVLLPLISKVPEPPLLVGYCLGGTMALAAAVRGNVAALATIAAPWNFAGYGDVARAEMASLWETARPTCEALGLVPMEVLQSGFWKLDPARTIGKYAAFATMADTDAATFVALEDWANDGAPLTLATGRQLFENFLRDDAPGQSRWQVGGQTISPAELDCPAIEFVSLSDRIVPAATAAGLVERRDLGAGHVGMVVGSRARSGLWEPLADWLRGAAAST